jgi:hypothetical protein
MVAAMRKRKMQVEYMDAGGHGHPLPLKAIQRMVEFVAAQMNEGR